MTIVEKIRESLLLKGAIKYVCINKNDGFFLIKTPNTYLRANEKEGEVVLLGDNAFSGEYAFSAPYKNGCAILHGKKLYFRWDNKEVESYLKKYRKQIDESPEFILSNLYDSIKKPKDSIVLKNGKIMQLYEVDQIKLKDNLKIVSSKYFSPINELFRAIGLIKESRGKVKPQEKIRQELEKFIIAEFKTFKKKKPFPIAEIKQRLDKKVDSMCIDDYKIDQKYRLSESTIRRILQSVTKK